MLKQSLLELALATCFSSPRLANELKRQLQVLSTDRQPTAHEFQRICLNLLRDDLDQDYPRRFRLDDIDAILDIAWPQKMIFGPEGRNIPFFDMVFSRIFIENGDYIQYRDGKLQDFARFSARLDPALLAMWHLAQRITRSPFLSTHDVTRIVNAQQPFFSPIPIEKDNFAENHIHQGGAYFAGMVLLNNISELEQRKNLEQDYKQLRYLVRGLLKEGSFLSNNNGPQQKYFMGNSENFDKSAIFKICFSESLHPNSSVAVLGPLAWQEWANNHVPDLPSEPRWLRQQLAICMQARDLDRAWLWFLLWLWMQYQHPECNCYVRMGILYLLNSLMYLRRKLIMDGVGLQRFCGYFSERSRQAPAVDKMNSSTRAIFQGKDDVAELKCGIYVFNEKSVAFFLQSLARESEVAVPENLRSLSNTQVESYRNLMERFHFCIHFPRSLEFFNDPDLVWRHADTYRKLIQCQNGWKLPAFLATQQMANLKFVPSRWVRGLDVAGDENLLKTEVYAPALRWLRKGLRAKNGYEPPSPGLHLSIHSGEDYPHPLSGMRHVDETVRFCEMRQGDRLGHALALGISPKKWLAAHGEMILPVEEHVDNLVWAWHYATVMSNSLPLAGQVLPLLTRRIHQLLKHVPWVCPGGVRLADDFVNEKSKNGNIDSDKRGYKDLVSQLTPETLFDAWCLRRNCYHHVNSGDDFAMDTEKMTIAVPDKKIFDRAANIKMGENWAVKLYQQRWRWLKQHIKVMEGDSITRFDLPPSNNSDIWPARNVRIRLQLEPHAHFDEDHKLESLFLLDDSHTEQELDFFEALQDWLLDKYDQIGLVIEANPTSNVYTALIDCYADHPIFRWYPPDEDWLKPGARFNRFGLRRGPIKVCVNTDDPGIMPTTLRTEFALLGEAALEHGVTRTNAERWLERLRVFGLQEFHRKHLPVWIAKKQSL